MFKKIIVFLIILSLWFLSSVFFPFDAGFYNSLNLPAFTPPKILFSIIWPVIFILITIAIYSIIKKDNQTKDYLYILIINYILIETYNLFFFYFNNLFLSLVNVTFTLVSSIFLTLETKKLTKNWYLLILYNVWSLYAFILMTTIYLSNWLIKSSNSLGKGHSKCKCSFVMGWTKSKVAECKNCPKIVHSLLV